MRKRSLPLVAVLTVLIGLVTAPAAYATFQVSEIQLPNGAVTFYSGFTGPADIRFNFNDYMDAGANDPETPFQLRLREQGGPNVHTQNITIDPDTQLSPKTIQFSWPALNTNVQKKYEVVVYQGTTRVGLPKVFTLKPYLVKITSISPDPFYPTIDDGFKDTTTIQWNLVANSNPVDLYIKSGATELRHVHWDNRVAGNYSYTWNGENAGSVIQPEGTYAVIVQATDSGQVFGQSQSNVVLDRFFTATASKVQEGSNFHHRSTTTVLRAGGTCSVARLTTPKDVRINCTDARVRVFWRWTLNEPDAAIQTQSFTLVAVPGYTCGATFGRTGSTSGSDTWIGVGALGQRRCRVDKTRINFTFTDES